MVALLMPAACWMARVCVPAPCMRTWKGRRLGVPVWVDCTTEVVGVWHLLQLPVLNRSVE